MTSRTNLPGNHDWIEASKNVQLAAKLYDYERRNEGILKDFERVLNLKGRNNESPLTV